MSLAKKSPEPAGDRMASRTDVSSSCAQGVTLQRALIVGGAAALLAVSNGAAALLPVSNGAAAAPASVENTHEISTEQHSSTTPVLRDRVLLL